MKMIRYASILIFRKFTVIVFSTLLTIVSFSNLSLSMPRRLGFYKFHPFTSFWIGRNNSPQTYM